MKSVLRPLLSERTTLRLGGRAIAELFPATPDDFDELGTALQRLGGAPHVLGGGSNLLVRDGDLPVVLVSPRTGDRLDDGRPAVPEILGTSSEEGTPRMIVRAGAGIPMPRLLSWCASHGCSGLEGLVGIPGRLGGAVAMNAGAYGCSMAPLLRSITVFMPEKGLVRLQPSDWTASYRHFSPLEPCPWFAVVEAVMEFPARSEAEVKAAMNASIAAKKTTQPISEHTAGCIFKNPEGLSAGRLLDSAGAKKLRLGAMKFSSLHANFLVHDTACGRQGRTVDALELIEEARSLVFSTHGVMLEPEVRIWPCL